MSSAIHSRIAALLERRTAPASRAGALEGLEELDPSHLPRWKSALTRAGRSGYGSYFPFVLAHQRPGHRTIYFGEDAGSVCAFKLKETDRGPHLDVLVAPMPMNVAVTRRCLERANDFNGDRSARILRIDAEDVGVAAGIRGLNVHERRAQYLYEPRAFGELRGGKYRTLRYQISKVRRLGDLEVVPYTGTCAAACRTLLEAWSERHRAQFGTSGDAAISKRALALMDVLDAPDLFGEVILLDGKLVAFTLGGEVRPGVGCLFEAKSDLRFPGLTYFQWWNFLSKLESCERVNGGSDARRTGLRQMKESLRPVAMHAEYRGVQVVS